MTVLSSDSIFTPLCHGRRKTTLKGIIKALIPLTKEKGLHPDIWYLTARDLKDVCLFRCHPFGLVLGGFRSINSLTDSHLDHQHRTFGFLFLRSQGLTKSRVLEWKGSTDFSTWHEPYIPPGWHEVSFGKLVWKNGQQTCFHPHTSHSSLRPTTPCRFPHLRHVLLMLLSLVLKADDVSFWVQWFPQAEEILRGIRTWISCLR